MNKTFKEEYIDYLKQILRYTKIVLNWIICLFPFILFMIDSMIGDPEAVTNADFGYAILINAIWAPLPAWFYFRNFYSSPWDYILAFLKLFILLPYCMILLIVLPIVVCLLPVDIFVVICLLFGPGTVMIPLFILAIILNIFWAPVATVILNKIYKLIP